MNGSKKESQIALSVFLVVLQRCFVTKVKLSDTAGASKPTVSVSPLKLLLKCTFVGFFTSFVDAFKAVEGRCCVMTEVASANVRQCCSV